MSAREDWRTLGDIAETLEAMKAQGMTRGAVPYAVDRVFFDEMPLGTEERAALAARLKGEARS